MVSAFLGKQGMDSIMKYTLIVLSPSSNQLSHYCLTADIPHLSQDHLLVLTLDRADPFKNHILVSYLVSLIHKPIFPLTIYVFFISTAVKALTCVTVSSGQK